MSDVLSNRIDEVCSPPAGQVRSAQAEESVPTVRPPPSRSTAVPSRRAKHPASIGDYHVICVLGAGGMAQVYLCQSRGIGGFSKLVVVKAPRAEVLSDADTVEMFLNEARIAGRLNHPNVVQTHDVGMCDDVPFIAMEYLEGRSLSELQRKIGLEHLSTDFQLRIISNALAGLHYAHDLEDYDGAPLGIVHRDVSPHNVFVTYGGVTKLLDFGIAKAAGSTNLTRGGVLKGKLAYMAPEQGALEDVDRRADLFSMGVMIWEAVTHRRLVAQGSNEMSVHMRRVTGTDPGVLDVRPDAPPELAAICARAMAREPGDRYATALELKQAIDDYLVNSSRPDDGAIGRFVSEAFAEDRIAVRAKIDERRKESLAPPAATATRDRGSDSEGSSAATTLDASRASVLVAPSNRMRMLVGALALTAVGLLATQLGSRPKADAAAQAMTPAQQQQPQQEAQQPVEASPSAPPVRAAQKVRITLRASPASSELAVDGARVEGGMLEEDVVPSATLHRVRVSKPGFAPQERVVAFDQDLQVSIVLTPLAPSRLTPAPAPTPVSKSANAPVPALRPIDDKDPYR